MKKSPIDRNKLIEIAVISDIHCHSESDCEGKKESYLIAEALRKPSGRHPVQSLLDKIKKESITADALICTGDISHKISQSGFVSAWGFLQEIQRSLGSEHIFSTLGNHDVNSRTDTADPFHIAKGIHPDFPFPERADNDLFWANGYCLQSLNDSVDILVINTAHNHYSEVLAKCGTFTDSDIYSLNEYLGLKDKPLIRIAILHHHPILHSFANFDSKDVLSTGDQLLNVLAEHNFQIVIHGHRHQPRVTRFFSGSKEMYIICAGSFSARLEELSSLTRNLFHKIYIYLDKYNKPCIRMKSWEFNYSIGWNIPNEQSALIPHVVRIGPKRCLDKIADEINEWFSTNDNDIIKNPELTSNFPDLYNLTPDEITEIKKILYKKNLKLVVNKLGEFSGLGKIQK